MPLRHLRFPTDSAAVFPPALALSFVLLAALAHGYPGASVLGAGIAGALYVFRSRAWASAALAGAIIWSLLQRSVVSPDFWAPVLLMAAAILLPPRPLSMLIRVPRLLWPICLLIGTICLAIAMFRPGLPESLFIIPACLCAALLGAGLTRHLALADARVLAWGEHGLETITRDLLLGRITSGMLHDLSQPLNVISMANGNLGYLAEHLDIAPEKRTQMVERIRRISTSTESAATILSLFRWFGRDGSTDHGLLSIRSALERAIAVTRSNVRHSGVAVDLRGDALDYLLPTRHGTVEMMAVAALLSAFGGFMPADGDQTRIHGTVLVRADLTGAHVAITIQCNDDQGQPTILCEIDRATLWLVEQVARESGSVFRHIRRRGQSLCFRILVARDDI